MCYTCGTSLPDAWPTLKNPDISAFDPNVQRRVYPWLCEKLQLDGMLIFMMNGWPQQTPTLPNGHNEFSTKRETRWPASEWITDSATYYLVYPSPDGTMWPCLRLDAIRDGLQDYEYIHAAKELLKKHPNADLEKLVEVDDALVSRTNVYSLDAGAYEARRLAIGKYLER
jgi:hypothetical protein